ncbi:MAG: metallophosphoesterase [Planctomycetota bacterium]|nr:metallophosphoesterase [Planctomycetota bacterium]
MHRVVWLTDLHLNHCDDELVDQLFADVNSRQPDSIWIGGDFSESFQLLRYLRWIDHVFTCPVYFVLGNHDFYFASIGMMRDQVAELASGKENLHYLSFSEPIRLSERSALIGHDGWSDGRLGDFEKSVVMMHDYHTINDLAGHNKRDRWEVLKKLGDEAGNHIKAQLATAFESYDHVYILTHVPPTRCSCWHNGNISDDQWAPHFTCKAVGDVIREALRKHPDKRVTVYCGHTHGEGESEPQHNWKIVTGKALYGHPSIAGLFEVE